MNHESDSWAVEQRKTDIPEFQSWQHSCEERADLWNMPMLGFQVLLKGKL